MTLALKLREPTVPAEASAAAAAVAAAAAQQIAAGQKHAPFQSPRDGRALRQVPPSQRLAQVQVASALEAVFLQRRDVLLEAQLRLDGLRPRPRPHLSRSASRLRGATVLGAEAPLLPPVPQRALLAWLRGWTYLQAGHPCQAVKDAKTAIAYTTEEHSVLPDSILAYAAGKGGPGAEGLRDNKPSHSASASADSKAAIANPLLAGCWPAAFLLLYEAQAAAGEAPELAALSALRARDLLGETAELRRLTPRLHCTSSASADLAGLANVGNVPELHGQDASGEGSQTEAAQVVLTELQQAQRRRAGAALEGAVARLPEDAWEAVRDGGVQGLLALLARRAQERLPDFLRPRPRWHYYNMWMRQRIAAVAPQLPEPVVAKLVEATDATDLDLLLQHPLALLAQAEEYRQVLDAHGTEGLLSYEAEPLSWDEMQALAGGGLVGLPLGYDASQHVPRHLPLPQPPDEVDLALLIGDRGQACSHSASENSSPVLEDPSYGSAAGGLQLAPDATSAAAVTASGVGETAGSKKECPATCFRMPNGSGATGAQAGAQVPLGLQAWGATEAAPEAAQLPNPLVGPGAVQAARTYLQLALPHGGWDAERLGKEREMGAPEGDPGVTAASGGVPLAVARRREMVMRAAQMAKEAALSGSSDGGVRGCGECCVRLGVEQRVEVVEVFGEAVRKMVVEKDEGAHGDELIVEAEAGNMAAALEERKEEETEGLQRCINVWSSEGFPQVDLLSLD